MRHFTLLQYDTMGDDLMLGLTLEGGAARSVFAAGVTDVLLEENIIADVIVGVSAGIAFATSYASGQHGRNLEIALHYMPTKKYMGLRHLLNPKNRSYYNMDYVFYDIPEHIVPFDYAALAAYPGKIYCVVTNLDTGKPEYIELPRTDHRNMYMRASCALPIMFPIFHLDGKNYMDGGITDSIPYKKAMDEGCDKNIVILTREIGYTKTTDRATAYAARKFRKYSEFSAAILHRADMYNRKVAELEELERRGKVFILRPDTTEGIARTESDPKVLRMLYDKGADLMRSRIGELRDYLAK